MENDDVKKTDAVMKTDDVMKSDDATATSESMQRNFISGAIVAPIRT
jgi:hypothetical protein